MQVSWQGLFLGCLLLAAAYGTEECLDNDGRSYQGTRQVTADGLQCLNWLQVQKTSITPSPTAAEDHSYCRNPDGEVGPWCYVTSKGGMPEKRLCGFQQCQALETPSPAAKIDDLRDIDAGEKEVFEPADVLPSRSESAAVQPVIGISQRVKVNPKEKKDLGTLGYVLGVLMMVIIIAIGSGIVVGYIYKRGRDLKKQHEQTVYEREMQRITLPLSAFSNPTCEIVDENTIVVHASQTPVEEGLQEGDAPLMGQAGTPGA